MHESIEIFIVLLFAIILLIGAATRGFSRITGVPYTILMLTLGFSAGLYIRYFAASHGIFSFFHATEHHNIISPELILFVFLPMLIFESAFSLDAHIFKKSLGNIILLAGPAMIVATILTAYFLLAIMPSTWQWTMSYALLFGALINATDPVAVVALLRELGISKRLVTLIEGESLLNDGTAIVLFTVFLAVSLNGYEQFSMSQAALQFCKVVIGGCLIGWILAQFISRWMGRIFNDPLVEITLMMALAYLCMVIAEHYFHVSGVMALVVAGLYMSSTGRTRISPEVMDFLHEFWNTMSYIANTVIFFLVGLVIALQFHVFELSDLWVAFVAYLGIMLIRFIVVFAFKPAYSLMRTPISNDSATIAAWGGLRGAVSLALALMLSQTDGLDQSFRQQALLITVFIVLFTVIFNGSTMKYLLRFFGLDQAPLATQITASLAKISVLTDVKKLIDKLSHSSNFKNVYWSDVRGELEKIYTQTKTNCEQLEAKIESSKLEHEAEFWLRVLHIERNAYWELFAQGILSDKAISILNHEIDLQLDDLKENRINPPAQRTPKISTTYLVFRYLLQRFPILKKYLAGVVFDMITLNFHFYHAELYAAERVLDHLANLEGMNKTFESHIRDTYTHYRNSAKERLEEMRVDLPEITQAMETYFAKRLTLNHERAGIIDLLAHGVLEEGAAKESLANVESRMHGMRRLPKSIKLPTARDLIKEVPLFALCTETETIDVANAFVEHIILKGEYLFHEGEQSDSLFIIIRGALEVAKTIDGNLTVLGILGGGDIVGEMALLTGQPRMASALAVTTVTLLKINARDFHRLTLKYPQLLDHTWAAYGRHAFENLWPKHALLKHYSREEIAHFAATATECALAKDQSIEPPVDVTHVFVITGQLKVNGTLLQAYELQSVVQGQTYHAILESRVLWLMLS